MKHWKALLALLIIALVAALIGGGWWAWTHWATFKLLIWYGFLAVTLFTLLSSTFFLLHPLDFIVRGRATPRGQRGEVLFSYAFGFLGLGATASPAAQKVWLRLGSREWPLWKNERDRVRPRRTPSDTPPGGGPSSEQASAQQTGTSSTVGGENAGRSSRPPEPFPGQPSVSDPIKPSFEVGKGSDDLVRTHAEGAEKTKPVQTLPQPHQVTKDAPVDARGMSVEEMLAHAPATPEESTKVPAAGDGKPHSKDLASAENDGEPFEEVVAPPVVLTDDAGFARNASPPGSQGPGGRPPGTGGTDGAGSDGDGERVEQPLWLDTLLTKLKRWRRTLAEARRKVREGWKISRRLWKRFSPILWRLAENLWATVSLLGPRVWVRHGLDAPEITGMLHGLASTVGGIARVFGARFEAVPVFCVQTIYVKGDVGVSVSSWKSLYCLLRFLCEKELWTGGLDLYRRYRARKAATDPSRPVDNTVPSGS